MTGVILYLAGDERNGHTFHVHVEEGCGEHALIRGESVEMPWLRAACSCGWRDRHNRFTVEENAHAKWLAHTQAGAA